jgi:hypothetical protein
MGDAKRRGTFEERKAAPKDPGASQRRVEARQAKRRARRVIRERIREQRRLAAQKETDGKASD